MDISYSLFFVVLLTTASCWQQPTQIQDSLLVQDCSFSNQHVGEINAFSYQNGTGIATPFMTNVKVCHQNFTLLEVEWKVYNSSLNAKLRGCNAPLYTQDTVEVFLGDPETFMKTYLEVEVNPLGAMFIARIYNKHDNCTDLSNDMLSCYAPNVSASATTGKNSYIAKATIPLDLVTNTSPVYHIKANFFRIDLSDDGHRDYSCWNPTFYTPACFHKPSAFKDLFLI